MVFYKKNLFIEWSLGSQGIHIISPRGQADLEQKESTLELLMKMNTYWNTTSLRKAFNTWSFDFQGKYIVYI